MFPSDTYEESCVCSKEGDANKDGLPPGIERPQHIATAEEELSITLNESANLFPDESQQSTLIAGNEEAGSIPTVHPFLLLGSMCLQRPLRVVKKYALLIVEG